MEREPLIAADTDTARSAVVVAASYLVTASLGGILAVLIAVVAGEGAKTDSFLASYSVYLVFLLLGATLRATLIPLIGATDSDAELRERAADAVRRLVSVALLLCVALAVLSPVIAPLLRSGPNAAVGTAAESLAVLAIASFGQIWSAALAATLAAARRFYASAAFYVVASVTTLVVAVGLMLAVGVLGAAFGVLAGAVVLLGGHLLYLRRLGFSAPPGPLLLASPATWRLAGRAGASASWPLAQQLQLTIALAALATPVGAVTAYTYAFFVGAILYNITGATLGLVTLPSLVADLARQGRETAMTYLGITAPFGAFLYVPAAGAYAACGYPILDAVLGGSLSAETLTLLWDVSRTLLVMCFVWTVLTAVSNAALSLRLLRGLTLLSAAALVVQIVVQSLLSDPSGETVAVVHASVGSGMFLAAVVLVFRDRSAAALGRVVATCWPIVPLGLVFVAAALVAPTGAVAAFGLAVLAIVVYLALGALIWPRVGRQAFRLLLARR
jgi:peptidoglycan biosynthesis protein MviN/MurJ (putative lipid II flippase)